MRTRLFVPLAFAVLLQLHGAPAWAQSVPPASAQSAQPVNTPPPVEHTGWRTLLKDTGRDFVAFPKRKSTWVMLGAGAAAALAVYPADDDIAEHIAGNEAAGNFFTLGKWLGSAQVQIGSAVGLWVVGRYIMPQASGGPKTNKVSHLGFDLMRAQIVSQTMVQAMKVSFRRDRPSGECCAFPSGHSAAAFAAASVLERHFGYRGSWPALVGAAYVATSRLVDNRHFLSDVVFGAVLGEAAGWTVVGRHGRDKYALVPTPIRGGIMISLSRVAD